MYLYLQYDKVPKQFESPFYRTVSSKIILKWFINDIQYHPVMPLEDFSIINIVFFKGNRKSNLSAYLGFKVFF